MEGYHKSVLLKEVIEALKVAGDKWYLDATLGDGGHSLGIIKRGGRVIGVDVDPQAIERVEKRFRQEGIEQSKFKLIRGNFADSKNLIQQTENFDQKIAGAVFDLGVSSMQLETPERGFSFMKEGPLDMRMDPNLSVRALDLVNALNKGELYELFTKLGEEKFAKTLVDVVISTRWLKPFETTKELADVIEKRLRKRGKIHPATKVFQALRIAVNDELNVLKEGLKSVYDLIEKNGNIAVISFHSLEDRIVKNTFKQWEDQGMGEVLTDKPVESSEEDLRKNIRARSAKMRVFKKL